MKFNSIPLIEVICRKTYRYMLFFSPKNPTPQQLAFLTALYNSIVILLILLVSSSLTPLAPVSLTRSDPAKSTKLIFPTLTYFWQSSVTSLSGSTGDIYSTITMNTAWDRLEMLFNLVDAVILEWDPFRSKERNFLGVRTTNSERPSTYMPLFVSSRI